MRLYCENIGLLNKCDIDIDDLSIIGGENSTGKSTIGKLLFVIIKTCNKFEAEKEFNENKIRKINSLINNLFKNVEEAYEEFGYFWLSTSVQTIGKNFLNSIRGLNIDKDSEHIDYAINNLLEKINELICDETNIFLSQDDNWDDLFKSSGLQSEINKQKNKKSIEELLMTPSVQHTINLIKSEVMNKFDMNKELFIRFNKYKDSVFGGNISNIYSDKNSIIQLYNKEKLIFDVQINNDIIGKFEFNGEIPFKDVTFVESPVLLQVNNLIKKARSRYELTNISELVFSEEIVADHIKDYINKLIALPKSQIGANRINNIIGGKFSYNEQKEGFEFEKGDNIKFSMDTVASGIKNFGVLQLLLEKDILNRDHLLILDEPEVNLHPKWQLEYAKVIVELIEKEIPILITSHSPYMIQAINFYSNEYKIKDKVKIYLADGVNKEEYDFIHEIENSTSKQDLEKIKSEMNEDYKKKEYYIIEDVTFSLDKLFEKLSEPMEGIIG